MAPNGPFSELAVARGSASLTILSGAARRCFLSKSLQGLDQLAQVAGDDGVELVERQVDAVVGDAVLREVVGADALAAVAGADQGAALLGPLAGAASAAAVRRAGCAGCAWPGRSSCAGCARPGT